MLWFNSKDDSSSIEEDKMLEENGTMFVVAKDRNNYPQMQTSIETKDCMVSKERLGKEARKDKRDTIRTQESMFSLRAVNENHLTRD